MCQETRVDRDPERTYISATFDPLAGVAEWQTRWTQNPLSERACGFESRPGHRQAIRPRTAGATRG